MERNHTLHVVIGNRSRPVTLRGSSDSPVQPPFQAIWRAQASGAGVPAVGSRVRHFPTVSIGHSHGVGAQGTWPSHISSCRPLAFAQTGWNPNGPRPDHSGAASAKACAVRRTTNRTRSKAAPRARCLAGTTPSWRAFALVAAAHDAQCRRHGALARGQDRISSITVTSGIANYCRLPGGAGQCRWGGNLQD